MPSPYREIFAEPGARSFTAAGLLGRLPIAMVGLAIVTMVSQLTGEYALAGALAATVALSNVVLGPQVARLVDALGQRRVLRPAALVTACAVGVLTLSTHLGWPAWTLFVCAAGAGCTPSLGSMVRSRWAALFPRSPAKLHAAFSWESTVDETCFVIGPFLAIGLSTVWFPQAGALAAVAFLTVGVFWLTSQRATEPVPRPREERGRRTALRTRGMPLLFLTMVTLGVIFGSVDVITVAFAEEQGAKTAASALLALYALGSGLAGGLFGLLKPGADLVRRWLLCTTAAGASLVPLQLAGSLGWLAVALFAAGIMVAPTMISTIGLVERLVPRGNLTEGMTWMSTGAMLGVSVGASVSGQVVDRVGADRAYLVPAAAGALVMALALTGTRGLRRLASRRQQEGTDHERHQHSDRRQQEGCHLAQLGGEHEREAAAHRGALDDRGARRDRPPGG